MIGIAVVFTDCMEITLDLREIEQLKRSQTVVSFLTGLPVGKSFILFDDEDPKSILEKLEVQGPLKLKLEYLETGPKYWKLKLTRQSETDAESEEGCCGCCGH